MIDYLVAGIWGFEKTGKTTLSATFPKPIYHFDLDVGGFARAAWRMDVKEIVSVPYPVPMQMEKLEVGKFTVATDAKGKVTIRTPKKLVGYMELWNNIIADFVAVCQNAWVNEKGENIQFKTIVIDTSTTLWSDCHSAYLQEQQEKQLAQGYKIDDIRERLTSIEFGPSNERMKSIIQTARSYRKNLVLTHYPRDVYKTRLDSDGRNIEYKSGEEEPDGFKQTKALVDLMIRTYLDRQKPMAKITTSGLSMSLNDMTFEDPTYDMIMDKVRFVRGETEGIG